LLQGIQIQSTDDGSATLYLPELLETYHSNKGALGESWHVYIHNGLLPKLADSSTLNILEVGFGTGLNVLLSLEAAANHQTIRMISLEPYLLPISTIQAYYQHFEKVPKYVNVLSNLLACEQMASIHEGFEFQLIQSKLETFSPSQMAIQAPIDLVYFDAFAPSKQPEVWQMDCLQKLYNIMAHKGRLVTYCAQGLFKRNLKQIGFEVYNPHGAFGKREMTVAIKP
jgi:tRNA U34 5-methylaminomethyl-2-thiouridine-forming methyltransferase MnmC